jgi:8-oxoguanine deaminase
MHAVKLRGGEMLIRDGFIEAVGERNSMSPRADVIVDLAGHIVLPGLINTHHHLYQSLDRAWPASQNMSLTGWLQGLYPRWETLTPGTIARAVELGLAEIVLSGCTTVADHQYLWPKGLAASALFDIAAGFGIRFHLGRGSQDLGRAQGGFAPESLVEQADHILAHTADLIAQFHDTRPGSFRQVFVAPSSLRSATAELLRASAVLAAEKGVQLHFHLGETAGEIDFALHKYGKRPVQVAQELGCLTAETWLAHGVHFNPDDVAVLRRCGCGICHCPSSHMRLGSGIAPVRHYLDQAIMVGLGSTDRRPMTPRTCCPRFVPPFCCREWPRKMTQASSARGPCSRWRPETERSSWGAMTSVAWCRAVRRTSLPSTAAESNSRVRRTPSLRSHSAP